MKNAKLKSKIQNCFKFLVVVFSFSFLLLNLSFVHAAALVPCGTKDNPTACTICDLFKLVKNIVNFLTIDIATPLAIIILIYGGVKLITAGGSEEKVKQGQTAVRRAAYGLLFVFGAWLIVNTLLTWVGNSDLLKSYWPGLSGCV